MPPVPSGTIAVAAYEIIAGKNGIGLSRSTTNSVGDTMWNPARSVALAAMSRSAP